MSIILQPVVFDAEGRFVNRDFTYDGEPGELTVEVKPGPEALAVTRFEGDEHELRASGKEAEEMYDQSITDPGAVAMIRRAIVEMRAEN